MKKITILFVLLIFGCFSNTNLFSQTLLVTEGFEDGGGLGEGTSYKSNTYQDGDTNASADDFWARTNVSPMAGSTNNQTYTGWTGTHHWNGEDIDDNGNPLGTGSNGYVVLQTLDASIYAGGTGTVSLQLAADINGTGNWQTTDGIFIEYAFDGDVATGANSIGGLPSSLANVATGTYNIAGAFYGTGLVSPNEFLQEDTDLNGSGDGDALTNTFTTYSFDFAIPNGATNMSIRVRGAGGSGGEIVAFDHIQVFGTSGGDSTAPTLTSSSPTDGATEISTSSNIVLTFDENIAFGTGNIEVIDETDGTNSFTINAASPGAETSISGAILTINPNASIDENSSYSVRIATTAIDDLAGNSYAGITNNSTLNFNTAGVTGLQTIYNNDFETCESGYSEFGSYSDGSSDYFIRTNGTTDEANCSTSVTIGDLVYTNTNGYYYTGEDVDRDLENPNTTGEFGSTALTSGVHFNNIDVSGYTNVTISCNFAASESSAFENGDYIRIFVDKTNNGTYELLGAFETVDGLGNENLSQDTDLDGSGDGTILSQAFQTFTFSVLGATNMDVRIEILSSASSEEMAFDTFVVQTELAAGDSTAPILTLSSPTDGATGISTSSNIVLTFDENIAFGTGNIEVIDETDGTNSFTINAASPGAEASISGAILTINPSASIDENSSYSVRIATTAIDDLAGNSYAGIIDDTTLNFNTADETNPTFNAAGSTPADDATGVSITADIVLTFSEDIALGTSGYLSIENLDDMFGVTIQFFVATDSDGATTTPSAGKIGVVGNKIYLNPSSNLDEQTNYNINIQSTAVDDTSGNSFAGFGGVGTFNFTTGELTAPVFENSTPSQSSVAQTTFTLGTDIDETGTIYYVVVADGASAPTSAQVKAGTDASNSTPVDNGSAAVSTGGFTNDFNVTGLTAAAAYDVYVVAEDDEGTPNLQTAPTKVDVTTASLISLTITGITGDDKVYDDTTAGSASGTASLSGVETGDDVTLGGSPVFTFASANVGTGITVTTTGYTISGAQSGNYTLSQSTGLSADITAKGLTITGITGDDKVYDDTRAGSASGTASLSGVETGDDVTLGGSPVFTFSSADVGTGIAVTTSGYTISGAQSGNYTLSQPTGLSADITAKGLTITGITGDDKVYDDTTAGSASGTAALSGVETGDDVTLGGSPVFTFASANVGTGITITTTGFTISGAQSGNYMITQPTGLTANITAKNLTIDVSADDKIFDGTTTATVTLGTPSLVGIEGADDLSIDGTPSAFNFASAAVGTGISVTATGNYTLTGTDSGNYTITQPTGLTADITATLGLEDISLKDSINIYPNPVNNILNIKTNTVVIQEVTLYDVLGKSIKDINLNINTIDTSNINTGIYLLKIKTDEGTLIKRIIKK